MADGTIEIDVKLNDSQATSQAETIGNNLANQIENGVNSASKTAQTSTQTAMKNIGSSLTSYGTSMTKAVTVPILAAATASGAAAVKIDTALTGVRKTVDGTEEQYEALKDAAIEFSKTNAVDPAQILDIQALGAQLGYSIDELDKFSEVVSGLDIATNMDAETAAMQLASFSNIMNMSHDDVDRYGATIVDLGNNFATTESDISEMAQRIAGAGAQIGMSEADVLGMATALSSMGINAEAGGTAISTIMSTIDKAVATGGEKLETWAQTAQMSADEFAAAWKSDPVSALNSVLVGMDSATESGGNMSLMLDELGISSIRQTDLFKRLANNTEMLPNAVNTANKAWEENVALDKEVENRNNSMAAQLEILMNKIEAVAIEVGEPLMNALIQILDMAEPLINMLASGAKSFSGLDESGQKVIIMAVAAAAAFGPLTTGVGKLLSATGKTADRWKTFSDNIKVLKNNLSQTSPQVDNLAKSTQKAGEKAQQATKETEKYTASNAQSQSTIKTVTTATNAQTTATKLSTTAMKAAKVAGAALGNVLKTIAPIAIFSALAAVVTKISEAISDAKERSENYSKATSGLEDAILTTTGAVQSENTALEGTQAAIDSVDIDDLIDKHVQLADSLRETAEETNASVSLLGQYGDSISRLAGEAGLSEPEVAELKNAIDEVNTATGQSYTVAQDANGAWQIMADGVVVAKDAVLDLIEAQQIQLQLEATKEQYKSVYSQLQQDAEAYASQLQKVNDAEAKYNDALQDVTDGVPYAANVARGYYSQLEKERDKLSELEGTMGSSQSAANKLTEKMNLQKMALDENASALSKYVAGNIELQSAIQSAGVPLDTFVEDLSNMGMSVEDLSSIMETEGIEGISNFANAYKNGSDELLAWAQEHGKDIPQSFIDSMNSKSGEAQESGYNTGASEAQGLYAGLSENAQLAIDEALSTVDMTVEEFDKLASAAGVSGEEGAIAYANGIAEQRQAAKDSALNDVNAAMGSFSSGNTTSYGSARGQEYASGIKQTQKTVKLESTAVADASAKGMQSQNGNAKSWGLDLGQLFANGISAAKSFVSNAANAISGVVSSILGHSIPKEGILRNGGQGEKPWGRHLVENFAEGMLEGKQDAVDAANEIARDISDELLAQFAAIDAMGQIEASIGRGMSAASIIANSGGISNTTTWNINQPIASPDELMRQQRMVERYQLAGSML